MAPIALSAPEPVLVSYTKNALKPAIPAAEDKGLSLIPPPLPHVLNPETTYGDFRDDLARDGYAVVKGAIPLDRASAYREKAKDWLLSFGTPLSFDDPSTWTDANLPARNKIRTYAAYCVAHEKFMWDARLEPGVLDAFSAVWDTPDLLVSFDSLNITFPADAANTRKPWEHVDQSPLRRGVHCVQGIINLSPSGPRDGGLVVYPGSHRLHDELFDSASAEERGRRWLPMRDIYLFEGRELDWFRERGIRPHKVCAEPGDLILWDSRTVHYGADPGGEQVRTAIYAAYTPAAMASEEQTALKAQVFAQWGGTTHWPHDHIVVRSPHVLLEDGTRDPRDRDEPLEKPVLTKRLLQLAGVEPYEGGK